MMTSDDDDVYDYIRWRLKLEGETENMGVCTKEQKGVTAAVLMATPGLRLRGREKGKWILSLFSRDTRAFFRLPSGS